MAFCPPMSLTTRFAVLPPFDLSVGGGGGGVEKGNGGSGGSVVFSSSPVTPTRLWDEHIQEISRELEVICGSPRNRTRERTVSSQTSPRPPPSSLARQLSMGCVLKASPPSSSSTFKSPGLSSTFAKNQSLFRVGSQDRFHLEPFSFYHPHEAPVCHHRMMVRHEETQSKLNQQLALVCPIKSEELLPNRPSIKHCEHRHSDSHIVRRQMSSKSGVLYKVPLDQRKSEELFVSFSDDHVLRVCAYGSNGEEVLVEEVSIPTEVPIQSLVLSVFDDRWMYIQQRTEDAMVLDFTGTSAKFLPLIQENEAILQVEIFLRIPFEFDPEELTVKTVDDRVVVSGSKRSVAVGGEEGLVVGRASPLTVGLLGTPPASVCFVVILPLPVGTESRSVSAHFTRPHHLVITGRLHPTRRRYTF